MMEKVRSSTKEEMKNLKEELKKMHSASYKMQQFEKDADKILNSLIN